VAEKLAATGWVFLPPNATGDLEEWVAPRRKAAIDRIVKAVGNAPFGEMQLAADINRASHELPAYSKMPIDLVLVEGSDAHKRLRKVRRIRQNAEKVAILIESDPYVRATINKISTPFDIPPIKQLLLKLRSLEDSLEYLAKQWRSKADVPENLRNRRPSQLEWLAGVSLPLIYERHFLRQAGRSRNVSSGEPSGPMIRFVEATLKELGGQKFKRESIARAFTRYTSQRNAERVKPFGQKLKKRN
jgi:hypothetical protein